MRIALDAMGGDHAPGPIVAGAVQAALADPQLHVVLVGDQEQVEPLLADADRTRLEVFHCSQVVGMDESPVVALRRKPDNSIARCWQLLAQRKVDGIVGAGSTGAMVAGGLFTRRFLANVSRPGIAAIMPTLQGPCVLIDVGANTNPRPEQLFQYGVMGSIFARHVLQRPSPRIGLMNIGSEEGKGNELAKDTQALFKDSALRSQFLGNVEGRDINRGVADVIVCDGFVGNVVLKTCEGCYDFALKSAAQEVLAVLDGEARARAEQAFKAVVERHDYSTYGGAPLLGIDGVCIICHGSSGDRAIKNALGVAATYVRNRLNELIVKELQTMPAPAATG
jgi:glycerol-3-phosphate acyltransferase PlsX